MQVTIRESRQAIQITVSHGEGVEQFDYSNPGMLCGGDLRDILAACGIHASHDFNEE